MQARVVHCKAIQCKDINKSHTLSAVYLQQAAKQGCCCVHITCWLLGKSLAQLLHRRKL